MDITGIIAQSLTYILLVLTFSWYTRYGLEKLLTVYKTELGCKKTCSDLVLNLNSLASCCLGTAPAALCKNDFAGIDIVTIFGYNAADKIAESSCEFSPFLLN